MSAHLNEQLRRIPSVEKLLTSPEGEKLIANYGRPQTLSVIREALDMFRKTVFDGDESTLLNEEILRSATAILKEKSTPVLKKVVNCSGVIIHTNLGRSVLAEQAANAAYMAARSAVNLEYDLESGERGERDTIVEGLLTQLTGAESATIVNNNAASLFLVLNTLSFGRETIVSRGELIEIGGSFRLPEIMKKSGCALVEVGTTNRTYLRDYENAINDNTGLILKAHTSNYKIVGFTSAPSSCELARLAEAKHLPFVVDLGSGAFLDLKGAELGDEPTVRRTLDDGAMIVTFSGDKLLGGPQAGIIAGQADLVDKIKRNQLKRAVRCDKMTIAAMEATLRLYLDPDKAIESIPTLRALFRNLVDLQKVATEVANLLANYFGADADVTILDDICSAGSGSAPETAIKSVSVAIKHKTVNPNKLARWFRRLDPPVIGRVENDLFRLDMRLILRVNEISSSLPI